MSSNLKTAAVSHTEPVRGGNFYRLAIVGASTLKGKEVAEVLSDRNFPSVDVKLLDDEESMGKLETVGDEVTFIQSVRPEQFQNIDFTFFASDPESTRKAWKSARKAGSTIVDLSYALENEPEARIRAPGVERQLGQTAIPELQPAPAIVAHPAAVVLALLLLRAEMAGEIKRVMATVYEPASEHGQKGMDELHEQTVNLLSFQPLPKKVFDAQVAFNMLARYGEQSAPALSMLESRVLRHYKQIAGNGAPTPSLLMVQAPIFHGHAFSVHVELGQVADVEKISQALAGEHVVVTHGADDSPSNVNAAGQADIQVSVMPDASQAHGFWLWAASDNLRVAASTAVECAETMAAARPRGKIQ
jgi:aspartate-semialdehyde dehydrogenase